jgi:hypothetical protein
MPRINANQAEQKYKIARMTVGRWIRAGKIAADGDREVDEDELVALIEKSKAQKPHATIAEKKSRRPIVGFTLPKSPEVSPSVPPPAVHKAPASKKPSSSFPRGRDALPVGLVVGGDLLPGRQGSSGIERPDSDVSVQTKEADLGWKRYRARNAKLLYEEKKLKLLRIEAVLHAFSQIKAALDSLRTYGEREGPALLAFARDPITTEAAMISRLNADQDRNGRDIIDAVSRQLIALKKESKEAADSEPLPEPGSDPETDGNS